MNQINEEQVRMALLSAGIQVLDQPAAIAASVNAMLNGTAQVFAALPFEAEPANFSVVQLQQRP